MRWGPTPPHFLDGKQGHPRAWGWYLILTEETLQRGRRGQDPWRDEVGFWPSGEAEVKRRAGETQPT